MIIMKKTKHTKELVIGDIVVAFHEQNDDCRSNDCYKRFIGGYIVNIVGDIIYIKDVDTTVVVDRRNGVLVNKIENLSLKRLGQLIFDFYKIQLSEPEINAILANLNDTK